MAALPNKPHTVVSTDCDLSNHEEDILLNDVAMDVTVSNPSDGNILPVMLNLQDTMNILSQNMEKIGNAFLNTCSRNDSNSFQSSDDKPSRKRKRTLDRQSSHKKQCVQQVSSTDVSEDDDTDISDTELLTTHLAPVVNSDLDLLTQLESEFSGEEPTTNPISERLASIINKRFTSKLPDEKIKEKSEKYLRPSNCEQLSVPIVNQEIWNKLSKITKTQDLRMANIQKAITKASIAICNSVDVLLKSNTTPEVVTQLVDSIALLGNASQDISFKRRDLIRPSLNKEFSSLCSKNVPITGNQLFGEDLPKSLSAIKETNKLGKQVQQRKPEPQRASYANRTYDRTYNSTSHFLDKGNKFNYKPKEQYKNQKSNNHQYKKKQSTQK